MLLEVCIASVDDALAAEAGGADRLELNSALALGGLTPSLGTLLEVLAATRLPIVVMVRPRPGGFCYSAADFRVMQRDLDLLLTHGADAVAFGILHEDGTIDRERNRLLAAQAGPGRAVFHRAFDVTPEPFVALEQLVEIGLRRVLTSGQEETAYQGAALLRELIRRAAGRIEVLPGGGINRFTVADVVARTGCDQVHASLRQGRLDASTSARPQVSFVASPRSASGQYDATSAAAVAGLRSLLDSPGPQGPAH